MAELDEIRAQVFELYQQQRYEDALQVASEVAEQFPASSSYWKACLLAVQGHITEALTALQQGLVNGAWWPPLMLQRDPDLEAVRQAPEFDRIQSEAERRWKEAFSAAPEINAYPPTTSASGVLLIALHGSPGEAPEPFAQRWNAARDHGALLIVPTSSQPHGPEGGWTWADYERTRRDLGLVYDHARRNHDFDDRKVVVAGFSQGGRVAMAISLTRDPFDPCGFIALAPALHDHPLARDFAESPQPSRGYIIVGENDWARGSAKSLAASATSQGHDWRFDTVPNVGHHFPSDFDQRLVKAMAFVVASSPE